MDFPGGHKTHLRPTPLVGGLGIFVGILFTTLFIPGGYSNFGSLLSLSALVLFLGTIDDVSELSVFARMTGHSLIALVMAVVAGVQLESLGSILYERELELGFMAIPVTVFATVGVINAVNMSDGIDGLSGGLVTVALGFVAIMAFGQGDVATASFLVMIICSIIAFLSLNFRRPWHRRALVYLGDAGSTLLGFMLAWLLIDNSQGETRLFAPVYALWFLAIPLFDTVNLLIKRPLQRISPFTPGTDHLHHHLLNRGFSVEAVVLMLTSAAVFFGLIGLLGLYFDASESTMFVLFLACFAVYLVVVERVRPGLTTRESPA